MEYPDNNIDIEKEWDNYVDIKTDRLVDSDRKRETDTSTCIQRHKDRWKNREKIQTDENLTNRDIKTNGKTERRYSQMQT